MPVELWTRPSPWWRVLAECSAIRKARAEDSKWVLSRSLATKSIQGDKHEKETLRSPITGCGVDAVLVDRICCSPERLLRQTRGQPGFDGLQPSLKPG